MNRHLMLAAALAAAILLSRDVSSAQNAAATADTNADTYRSLSLFGDVFSKIKEDYVDNRLTCLLETLVQAAHGALADDRYFCRTQN